MRIRTQRVPAGYRELEYLESTGTQYINLGIGGTPTSYIEFSFQYTLLSNVYNRIFGSRSNVSSLLNMRSSVNTGGYFYLEWAGNYLSSPNVDLLKHIVILDCSNNIYKFDGVIKSNTFRCLGDTGNLWLFGTYGGGTDGGKRFFYYKQFDDNVLVRNLIPCERLSDNKPGMYDIVNNVFYTNSGTGEFIKGPYKDSYKLSLLRLPTTYQEVEYITFSGTQFFRTGINKLISPYSVKTIYNKTNTLVSDQCLVGQRQIGKFPNIYNNYYETVLGTIESINAPNNVITTIEINNQIGIIKNNVVVYPITTTSDRETNYELLIGAFSESDYSEAKWFYRGNIYDIEIYSGGKLFRHYIPCYRKSDNVIGLYDIVEGKFYTNQGSGTFTKGNDIKNLGMFTPKMIMYNYNQLFYPFTSDNWISNESSIVYNSDGSMIVTRTGNANYSGTQMSSSKASPFYASHKYFYSCKYYADTVAGKGASVGLNLYSTGSGYVITEAQDISEKTWYTDEKIFQPTRDSSGTIYPWIFVNQRSDRTVGDKITLKEIVFIDLTDWYGAGREPSTVAEFKERFYRDYYGSCSKSIRLTEAMINAEPVYGYNQLVQNGNFETTSLSGFYFGWHLKSYKLEDKILKFEQQSQYTLSGVGVYAQPVIGHKYFIGCDVISYNSGNVSFVTGFGYQYASGITVPAGKTTRYEVLLTKGSDTSSQYNYVTWGNNSASSTLYSWGIRNAVIIDLTDWYGAGSEPATVAEFKNNFPYKYYQYMKKTLLNKYMINELGTN